MLGYLIVVFVLVYTGVCQESQHYCNPVINIASNGKGNVQVSTAIQMEQARQMFQNVSSQLLNEYERRVSAFLDTLDISSKPRDCNDISSLGYKTTGVYRIFPKGSTGMRVRCDMETSNGGWTVIQRRVSDSDFYKTWNEYQVGFGDLNENFWLGNQQIHLISSQGWYELRVDLTSMDDETAYAQYQVFSIGDAESKYKLIVDGYHGTAGDSLAAFSGMKFSTKDKDNDAYSNNCATMYLGAWWYKSCHSSNLNGDYGNTAYAKGPVWNSWKGYYSPLKFTEMKIRQWQNPDETAIAVDPSE